MGGRVCKSSAPTPTPAPASPQPAGWQPVAVATTATTSMPPTPSPPSPPNHALAGYDRLPVTATEDYRRWEHDTQGTRTPPSVFIRGGETVRRGRRSTSRSRYHYLHGCGGAALDVPLNAPAVDCRAPCDVCYVTHRPMAVPIDPPARGTPAALRTGRCIPTQLTAAQRVEVGPRVAPHTEAALQAFAEMALARAAEAAFRRKRQQQQQQQQQQQPQPPPQPQHPQQSAAHADGDTHEGSSSDRSVDTAADRKHPDDDVAVVGAADADRLPVFAAEDYMRWVDATEGTRTPPSVFIRDAGARRGRYHYRHGCDGAAVELPLNASSLSARYPCTACYATHRPCPVPIDPPARDSPAALRTGRCIPTQLTAAQVAEIGSRVAPRLEATLQAFAEMALARKAEDARRRKQQQQPSPPQQQSVAHSHGDDHDDAAAADRNLQPPAAAAGAAVAPNAVNVGAAAGARRDCATQTDITPIPPPPLGTPPRRDNRRHSH